jgi:hypothetical protein
MHHKNLEVKSFFVSTSARDTAKYPNASSFAFDLPYTIKNVVGFGVRNYKFRKETFINSKNYTITYVIDGGASASVSLSKGDYSTIGDFLTELNTKIASTGIQFVVAANGYITVQYISLVPNPGNAVQQYIAIYACTAMDALGFPRGIVLKRPGSILTPIAGDFETFTSNGTASLPYIIQPSADMVLRITDIETIMSNNTNTNRASMILYSDQASYTMNPNIDAFVPLLQTQHRLQTLRIQLQNMKGELYDTDNYDASFILQFYCVPEEKDPRIF